MTTARAHQVPDKDDLYPTMEVTMPGPRRPI